MPTPVGHSLAGLAVYLGGRRHIHRRHLLAGALLIAAANVPDIDFLPGYLMGDPRAFHWGPTHSFFAAAMAGGCSGLIAAWVGRRAASVVILATIAYSSHIFMDLLLGPGPAPSLGLQVFWPFDTGRHLLPWRVFRMFPASVHDLGPVRALFTRDVVPLMWREAMILGPICLAAWVWGRRAVAQTPHGLTGTERRSRSIRMNDPRCDAAPQ